MKRPLLIGCAADRDGDGDSLEDMGPPSDKVIAPPIFGPGADEGSKGQFTGSPGGAAATIVYPLNGVMLAKNINQMRLAFTADAAARDVRVAEMRCLLARYEAELALQLALPEQELAAGYALWTSIVRPRLLADFGEGVLVTVAQAEAELQDELLARAERVQRGVYVPLQHRLRGRFVGRL